MLYSVREERPHDASRIHDLLASAFETDAEARLVDALRSAGGLTLSLVAEEADDIVGHIAFSPVVITTEHEVHAAVGLGPMATSPARRRRGIGAKLITEGLERLRAAEHRVCVVLGHADYYPRHGFLRASTLGIRWERPVPDDVFFVQALVPRALQGVSGVVRYRPEFSSV